jgi:hypothetical protein
MTKQELLNKVQATVYQNTTGNIGGRSLPELLISMVNELGCEEYNSRLGVEKNRLINQIKRYVYFNQTGDITGARLQNVLLQMVDGLWCQSKGE